RREERHPVRDTDLPRERFERRAFGPIAHDHELHVCMRARGGCESPDQMRDAVPGPKGPRKTGDECAVETQPCAYPLAVASGAEAPRVDAVRQHPEIGRASCRERASAW